MMRFDALLLAIGARPVEVVHGALTFRGPEDVAAFGRLLEELARRAGQQCRLRLARPRQVAAAAVRARPSVGRPPRVPRRRRHRLEARHERSGRRSRCSASGRAESVAGLLEEAGIEIMPGRAPHLLKDGRLGFEDGGYVDVERVVAAPELRVPYLKGVPRGARRLHPHGRPGPGQGPGARIRRRRRHILPDQAGWPGSPAGGRGGGGDRCAGRRACRTAAAGPSCSGLRSCTGSAPQFLRVKLSEQETTSTAGRSVLWWPPGKIAARHLAPYLAGRRGRTTPPLDDVEALLGEDPEGAEAQRTAALELAYTAADADAGWGTTTARSSGSRSPRS